MSRFVLSFRLDPSDTEASHDYFALDLNPGRRQRA